MIKIVSFGFRKDKMEFENFIELCRQGKTNPKFDSRSVEQGDIFVAMPGANVDGASFIADAAQNGASYIVCAKQSAQAAAEAAPKAEIVAVADPREALWRLAQAKWHTDESPMKIIGVTGTNGKTTCAWLLEHYFKSQGCKTGMLGTIAYRWPGHEEAAPLTTPDPLALHSILAQMLESGVDTVVMEVSSHALAQQRASGINFAGALFTNLTQDHLDFHKEMENYFRAKAKLFFDLPLPDKIMSINSDDKYGRRLLELAPAAMSYGLHRAFPGRKHLRGEIASLSPTGMKLKMYQDKQTWEMDTKLIGAFNALNLLAVQGIALQMGATPETLKCLESFTGVPGRLERVDNNRGLHIFVDYAHTPDALSNALKGLRGAGFKRIVTVFGCGGNRDRDKRPLMGKAVADNSDVAILTSDNPRNEAPEAIMRDVKPGLAKARHVLYEIDRRAATQRGIQSLGPDDALLVAGKGHENYQIVGNERHHYSDQEVIRELLGCA